jgi:DNA-3-methyladenine glycosylase
MSRLSASFFLDSDVVFVAKNLLGKMLISELDGHFTSGIITETEAYCGQNDKACHANNGKKTKRNEVMYRAGGVAYVYLCYGMHHLFNVVTNVENMADAVLIRAMEPIDGIDTMLKRRNQTEITKKLSSGPGSMSQALGVTTNLNGANLFGNVVWIEDPGTVLAENEICTSTRIGVAYAGEDAQKPWRFYMQNSIWVSKK